MSLPSNNSNWFNKTAPHHDTNASGTRTSSTGCFVNDWTTVKALRVTCYSILILISLLGNSLVIAVVRRYRGMRRTTNIFIANMAVANLVVTIVYMSRMIGMFLVGSEWIGGTLGLALCKTVPFLHGVSLLVSILTLLLISVELLCSILFPLKEFFSSNRTKVAIASVWLVALLARVPYFLSLRVVLHPSGRRSCSAKLKKFFGNPEARDIYYSILLVTFYALPLVLIIASYLVIVFHLRKLRAPGARQTAKHLNERRVKAIRNVVRRMIVVTVVFISSWITYFIAQLLFSIVPCSLRFWRLLLAHSNSALNPGVLYALFDRNLRRAFTSIIFGTDKTEAGLSRTQSGSRKYTSTEKTIKLKGNPTRARPSTRQQIEDDMEIT